MPYSTGDKLGPYEILEPIGAGGMGEVWKARDTRLNRIVAIKKLKGSHTARFEQEARAIAALNHPNICTLHDIGPDYLVMEYVEGKPLQGPLRVEDAITLARQIAAALEEAHAKGILHRDLKPANVLVTPKGSAKLLDFGLAKLMTDSGTEATQTIEGTVMGTAAYMAPEQAEGKPLSERSDVFSFGAVLYEILSGKRAFSGTSMAQVLSAVLRDDPPTLDAPPELAAIVQRCLRKSPTERFSSMSELKSALECVKITQASQASIAVLPFANMSRDADDDYFSDGLAEEIINALVKVPGLKVIARTSAFAFKGQNTDVRKIAEVLGVTNVLEGSVRRAGNRIRVTAQLITAADGTHLWSERYDREMADVFAVQDEISAAIAGTLQLKLAPASAGQRHMPSLAAYEAYLKYRYYQWRFTPEASQRSRECLEQALALDPKFALPYVGLADYNLALASIVGIRADQAMPRARELSRRALELDPDLPEAHAMLGIVAGQYDFDWSEAERRFGLAMAHPTISCHVRLWYALFYLFSVGRTEEARRQMDQALEEDPLYQMSYYVRAQVLNGLGRYDEVEAACRKAVEIDPQFWLGWQYLGLMTAIQGRHAEARDCAERAVAGNPLSPYSLGLMAGVLKNTGETEKSAALLANLKGDAYGGPLGLTCYHLACGEIDSAVEWCGKALELRIPSVITIVLRANEPRLRQSAGWPALLAKANLKEAS